MACVVQQKDARQWFAELSVDMDKVRFLPYFDVRVARLALNGCVCVCVCVKILEIIRVILKLYDQWKNFDDRKEIAAVLNKMPKPKPPPTRYVWSPVFLMACLNLFKVCMGVGQTWTFNRSHIIIRKHRTVHFGGGGGGCHVSNACQMRRL